MALLIRRIHHHPVRTELTNRLQHPGATGVVRHCARPQPGQPQPAPPHVLQEETGARERVHRAVEFDAEHDPTSRRPIISTTVFSPITCGRGGVDGGREDRPRAARRVHNHIPRGHSSEPAQETCDVPWGEHLLRVGLAPGAAPLGEHQGHHVNHPVPTSGDAGQPGGALRHTGHGPIIRRGPGVARVERGRHHREPLHRRPRAGLSTARRAPPAARAVHVISRTHSASGTVTAQESPCPLVQRLPARCCETPHIAPQCGSHDEARAQQRTVVGPYHTDALLQGAPHASRRDTDPHRLKIVNAADFIRVRVLTCGSRQAALLLPVLPCAGTDPGTRAMTVSWNRPE